MFVECFSSLLKSEDNLGDDDLVRLNSHVERLILVIRFLFLFAIYCIMYESTLYMSALRTPRGIVFILLIEYLLTCQSQMPSGKVF